MNVGGKKRSWVESKFAYEATHYAGFLIAFPAIGYIEMHGLHEYPQVCGPEILMCLTLCTLPSFELSIVELYRVETA